MSGWVEMSIDACKASSILRERHPRSAVSRAYYAAYAAVTAELVKDPGVTFSRGRGNPAHGQLLDLIQQSLKSREYSAKSIETIRRNLRDLRRDRERADYKPSEWIDEADARENLKRAEQHQRIEAAVMTLETLNEIAEVVLQQLEYRTRSAGMTRDFRILQGLSFQDDEHLWHVYVESTPPVERRGQFYDILNDIEEEMEQPPHSVKVMLVPVKSEKANSAPGS